MEFLDALTESLNAILGVGLVNLLVALIILIVGYLVAKLIERAIVAILRRTNLDDRLARAVGGEPAAVSVEEAIGTTIFYVIMLFVLIAFLQQLNLTIVTEPLNNLLNEIFVFLPRLLGAAVILFVGYLLARFLRRLVTNITGRLGVDRLAARVGLARPISNLLGTLVYALILIPTIIAALNALQIEAISAPAATMLQTFLNAIPAVFAAALLLVITYFIARLIAGIVRDLLAGLGFNELVARLGFYRMLPTQRPPSEIVATIVLVAIMLFAAIEAANLLGFEILAAIITQFLLFGARVLIAIVVLAIGFYLANLARDLILSSGGENAGLMATIARAAILIFTAAMALRELGLAEDIVNLAFGLTLGAIAVAAALAFGLGSRDIAHREVERLIASVRSEPHIIPPDEAAGGVDVDVEPPTSNL